MTERLTGEQLSCAGEGYDPVASRSASIGADCYIDPAFLEAERAEIFRRSWQFLCHEEKLREPGSYVTARSRTGASSRSGARTGCFAPSTTSASIAGTRC